MLNAITVQTEILSGVATLDERDRLFEIVKALRLTARRWYFGSIAINSILFVSLVIFASDVWDGGETSVPSYPGVFACLTLILLAFFGWPLAQHSQRLSNIMYPIQECPAGVVLTLESLATLRQVVTVDGEPVDGRLFASALVLLLLSTDPFDRKLVRTPSNARYSRGLLVLPDATLVGPVSRGPDRDESNGTGPKYPEGQPIERHEPALPDFTRQTLSRGAGQISNHSAWVMALSIDRDELIRRIEQLDVPGSDGRHEIAVKLALSEALPAMLESNEGGALARAVRAGGDAVRRQFGQAGVSSDSPDWIRKLIAPPAPWLKTQLSTPPEQALLRLELPERPRLPRI